MEIFATTPCLPQLFLLSFLAATILPIGSEWLLIVMVIQGFPLDQTIITATVGNFLGACSTYAIGLWGSQFLTKKVLRMDDKEIGRAKSLYVKFGIWSLLLSWLPIVGDPLCIVAGMFKVRFLHFSLLVFLGKFVRYATLAFFAYQSL